MTFIVDLHPITLSIVLLGALYSGTNLMVLLATSMVETTGHFPTTLPVSRTHLHYHDILPAVFIPVYLVHSKILLSCHNMDKTKVGAYSSWKTVAQMPTCTVQGV